MSQEAIQRLLDEIAAASGMGVTLDDLGGHLVAYSIKQGRADEARIRSLLDREVPAEVRAWEARHGLTATEPVEIPPNPELGMLTRLCVPLLYRGVRTGLLWVLQDEQAWDGHEVMGRIAALADRIEMLAAVQYRMASPDLDQRQHLGTVFEEACRGDRAALAEMAGWPSLRLGRPMRVVVTLQTVAAGSAQPDEHHIAQLRIGAQQALTSSTAVLVGSVQDTHTVALVRIAAGTGTDAGLQLHQQLESVVGPPTWGGCGRAAQFPWRLHTGVSSPFATVDDVATAYKHAVVAAQVAAVEPEIGPVSNWEHVGPYRFLADNLRGKAALRSDLLDLLRDNDPMGEFTSTLEVYYDQGDSVSRTAERLHLHRTTLYYRLRRIKEIIGVDPLSGFTRLELHMSLKASRWGRRPRI